MANFATAQEIIDQALQELGLGTVNLANTSNDATGYQILGILNALGDELLRVNDWQNLEMIMNFVGDGITDTFPMPADFGRQVNQTQWSTSDQRPLLGPTSPQIWSWTQYGIVSVGVYFRYRILNDVYTMFPIPGAGETFALYYISKNWVAAYVDPSVQPPITPPVYQDKILRPGDTPLFDRRLMVAGVKLKFWAQKGFDTTLLQQEFDYMLKSEKGMNAGAPMISLSSSGNRYLLSFLNVPQGNWNT